MCLCLVFGLSVIGTALLYPRHSTGVLLSPRKLANPGTLGRGASTSHSSHPSPEPTHLCFRSLKLTTLALNNSLQETEQQHRKTLACSRQDLCSWRHCHCCHMPGSLSSGCGRATETLGMRSKLQSQRQRGEDPALQGLATLKLKLLLPACSRFLVVVVYLTHRLALVPPLVGPPRGLFSLFFSSSTHSVCASSVLRTIGSSGKVT